MGDFYGDGRAHLALATCYQGSSGVTRYRNLGNGQFILASSISTASWVAAADLNKDGYSDLVIVVGDGCAGGGEPYAVLLNNGDGTFAAPVTSTVNATWVTAADVNGDGSPDLILTAYNDTAVTILLNQGIGTFGAAIRYPINWIVGPTTLADVDDDGRPDLLIPTNSGIAVMRNVGGGAFQEQYLLVVPNGNPTQVAVIDLNSDGHPTVIVADPTSGSTKTLLYQNQTATGCGYAINPSNVLLPAAASTTGTLTVTSARGCTWTAAPTSDSGWITITSGSSGTGNGQVSYSIAANSESARIGLISVGGQLISITQPAGIAPIALSESTLVDLGSQVTATTSADFNGDGRADLAFATSDGMTSVLTGTGRGISPHRSSTVLEHLRW